ncbi:1-deoxy-D-xylulose-5-phosphate synthase [Defluviimonas sp. SAOS-178_SWC]|uniref:1-deoxy-D-xylulose-5-phosphate synthase n=1 Tax=Defluviimonas sp. SAOS-178_SWC TaxID=3121287 RepID=UPI0032217EF7
MAPEPQSDNVKGGRHIDNWMDKLGQDLEMPKEFRIEQSRIMYIESKAEGLEGPAVIGRVYFSRSGKTIYYKGMKFQSLKGNGFKANYFEIESGEHYWISGPRKDQNDRLYGGNKGVIVDDDVREEYRSMLRG